MARKSKSTCCCVDVWSLGLSLGLLVAIGMAFVTFAAWQWGYGVKGLAIIADWYKGVEPTAMGVFVGASWGFLDGFIGGLLLGWIYNFFHKMRD